MSDATVFSQSRSIIFAKPITRIEVEGLLKKFVGVVGTPLSYNGVILGHIKILARLTTTKDFLFFSLTRLNHVDVKASPEWSRADDSTIHNMEIDINVLVFGHSINMVETIVDTSLQELQTSL